MQTRSVGDITRGWLHEARWELEDLALGPQAAWGYKATDRESLPLPVAVYELRSRPGLIVLQADAAGDREQFEVIRKNERLSLELQSMLLKHHVEYNMEAALAKVVILDRVFEEGLDKNLFWRRINILRMATLDAMFFLRRRALRTHSISQIDGLGSGRD